MKHSDITFATDTIHRPDEPRHFMAVTPVAGRVRILVGDAVLADSAAAFRLSEVGHRIYAPVIYFPRAAVRADLLPSDRTSHCPLKGDCMWYSVDLADGADLAWSYEAPFDFAAPIRGLVAFDPVRVTVEEGPA